MMQENDVLRTNPLPLPAGLQRRNSPKLDVATLRARSPQFRSMALELRTIKPGPTTPRIISSAHGLIKRMLLTYPAYAAGEYSYRSVYADLLKKLPETTKFIIVTHPSVIKDLKQCLAEAGVTRRTQIIEAPEYVQFLVWAEDPYVVVEDASTKRRATYLLEPFTFRRVSDAVIADIVGDATYIRSFQSPLYFQGGNVLIGDDFTLIGADYPANTLALVEQTGHIRVPDDVEAAEYVRQLYQQTFDPKRRLIYVGTTLPVPQETSRQVTINGEQWEEVIYVGTGEAQPIFHIDMFISLAGRGRNDKYRLLVGSPMMAEEILKQAPVPHAMAAIFDDIARTLQRQGFEVIRNPLPLTYVDDPQAKVRMWYFATANNCLVQIDSQDKRVWLPTYGHGSWSNLKAIDKANKRIWQKLGFHVTELADFHPFAQNLGSVHCIKKYLERVD